MMMTVSVYFYPPRRDSLYIALDGASRKATVKIMPLRFIKVQVIQKIASDTKISQEIGGNDDDYRFFYSESRNASTEETLPI